MPQKVILCVSQTRHAQGMPSRITYVNRWGDEISDCFEEFFDDIDARSSESDYDTYMENASHQYPEDDETSISNDETTSSDDNDLHDNLHLLPNDVQDPELPEGDDGDLHGVPHLPPNETYNPAAPDPVSSLTPANPDDEEDEGNDDRNGPDDTDIPVIDGVKGSLAEIDECEGECESDVSSNTMSSKLPPTESE